MVTVSQKKYTTFRGLVFAASQLFVREKYFCECAANIEVPKAYCQMIVYKHFAGVYAPLRDHKSPDKIIYVKAKTLCPDLIRSTFSHMDMPVY